MREAGSLWEEWLVELLIAATRRRRCDVASHDDDGADLEPVQRVVLQADAVPPPTTTAPRSIFELAQAMEAGPVRLHRYCVSKSASGCAASASAPPRRNVNTVARAGAVVRVSGLAYPGGRWTAERAERERIRRANIRPPKPSAAARVCKFGRGVTLPAPPAAGLVLQE